MKKRILMALAVISVLVNVAYCARYSGGTGEPNNPYRIATANDLNDIANHPNDFDEHFILVNDINLAEYTGTQFNIIGNDVNEFTGVFDGNGHTISNFTYESNGVNHIGLFGYVDDPNAEIKDLTLIDPNIDAGTCEYVGALTGRLGDGSVTDCCILGGSVTGNKRTGGLVGDNNGTILKCYATGSVTGHYDETGGLVGKNGGRISNSYATGRVTGDDWETGGLAGENWGGTISSCYAAGSVDGNKVTGGLVAYNYSGMILNCYAAALVSGDGQTGGLVGHSGGGGTISNCYSTGNVRGRDGTGGLVGVNGEVGTILNSYATGSVSGQSDTGGLVGIHISGSYTKSFWDRNVNPDVNGIGNTSDPNVIGETTANMQRRNTFTDAGWDFVGETANGPNDIWTIRENRDYPRLWWQQLYMPGERSIIKNGSFEADGYIGDIDAKAPKYWCDVNLPAGKFDGYVGVYGATHGDYALTIRVVADEQTVEDDIAMVSQQVYLADVNKITFDVTLSSALSFIPWDSNVRSAVVLIDGNDIWDSNDFQPNGQGEYLNQEVDINGINGSDLHTLALAVRTNIDDLPDIDYYADWDFVKFDTYCGGLGYLPGDFDLDCYVDMNDLRLFVDLWLVEGPGERYDLLPDGIIDFHDFSLFAGYWLANTDWQNWGDNNCYEMELLLGDIDYSGEVDYGDILELADNWLNAGGCNKADLNFDGVVDFKDFAVLTRDWQDRSWLYWVQ